MTLRVLAPHQVESFAKIYRIVGLAVTLDFVMCGVSYEWSYSDTSFKSLTWGLSPNPSHAKRVFRKTASRGRVLAARRLRAAPTP
jgi:hypothetical protein